MGAGPLRLYAAAVCLGVVACGKGGPTDPAKATRIEVLSGGNQSGGVGTALPNKVVVETSDAQGNPVAGVAVRVSTDLPGSGGGSVSPRNVSTDALGRAQITWTLGGQLGAQTLTVSSTGLPSVTVGANATPGPPSAVHPNSDIFQFAVVSKPVTAVPSVKVTDLFGNPIAGVPVTFELTVLGSVLDGTERVSDASGNAVLGSWIIGPDATLYGIRGRIAGGAAATFEARGIPATVTPVASIAQTANAGTAVQSAPAVRAAREDGSPLPGVPVNFVVTAGSGMIQGGTQVTGSNGIASALGWVLGSAAGENRVEAQVAGRPPVVFTATGVPGVVTSATATSPTSLTGFFGNFVGGSPALVVKDAQGNPVAGSSVTFELLQADGQLFGATQVSDFLGQVRLDGWRLGSTGSQAVRAIGAGFPPITFTAVATAPPPSTFKLEVRYPNTQPTTAQRAAFDNAAARWTSIILAGTAPYPVNEPASFCFPAMNEIVDGLIVFADLKPIDGLNGILGQAGPCIVRDDFGFLPAVGLMQFDTADLPGLEASGQINEVILHEMGHVLGFGTMWNFDPGPPFVSPTNPANAFLLGAGTSDPTFNGASARGAFLGAVAVGRTFTGVPVPVANVGGPGTRDSHWRESTLINELMTGNLNNGVNPLSAFTAASFRDLGYQVNDAVTDPYTFLATLMAPAPPLMSFVSGFQFVEGKLTEPIIVINRRGQTVARVPRR